MNSSVEKFFLKNHVTIVSKIIPLLKKGKFRNKQTLSRSQNQRMEWEYDKCCGKTQNFSDVTRKKFIFVMRM